MTDVVVRIPVKDTAIVLAFDPDSDVQARMARELDTPDRYEPGTWRSFVDLLKPGDCVIDIGAHVGVFTCLAAALVGPTGRVIAFEPNRPNRVQLLANIHRNGFENVTVDPRAVSDKLGRAIFHRCADNDGGHALYDPGLSPANVKTKRTPKKKMIDTVTVDTLPDLPRVALIKIDVEGMEPAVLRGAAKTITNHRPAVIAEVNPFGLSTQQWTESDVRQPFQWLGYREYGVSDVEPYQIPLTKDQTIQSNYVENNRMYLNVFNMLFLPP